ncbi:YfeC-like transcriptional regulator [Klebsiella indica]|uniref:Putative DNA-binding transcriptional regulator n=1 Tax=Klebsiella indica TaxID=2582917 RepID=A0A5R9LGY5_9ENTR|nr:YfeC-like transcriptional regulator [Klebsiella indica]TLV16177.1 putative DNA-binding transcriptional regulator [Klebsiella indica]
MMKLKDKMTAAELAKGLKLTRQTINRWAREQKWRTETIPGIKGGRARLIVIDQAVIDYLANSKEFRGLTIDNQLAEAPVNYFVNDADAVRRQIVETLHLMSRSEQLQLRDLLVREGISGFLSRLGITGAE